MKLYWPFSSDGRRFFKIEKLSLGQEMSVYVWWKDHPNCIFIKVTRKGFNILNLDTNRVLLKRHLYAKNMKGQEHPATGPIIAKFWIPSYIKIQTKENKNVAIS